ncbi:TonB-dependent receptor [Microbulbifer halophilus]|uniref:TonB-dependent receptor n=1 Tax=Microbulbifer halophilus TaxID=453963 RepID=A0ABW5E8P9_9GAMM|nr:TonB-dependent receptor [Microbulbifer halophilus]MCW8124943.1 TonB-dependent receptor [Microbulbifer halophilus]
MNHFHQKTGAGLLLALVSAVPVADAATDLETLSVTASRDQRSLTSLAESLAVISSDELRRVSAVHISEALARAPGVWISRGNGQEHLTALRSPVLTGAGSCGSFAIAEDGVPVRGTGFCNVNQLFDLNSEQAGRIEVLRGPASVLYGSDAQHGVINLISEAPAGGDSRLSLEAGANDYRRFKASGSRVAGRHGYRIGFNGASDGGYKRDSGFDQQKLTLRHDFDGGAVSARTLLNLSNLNQETAGYVSGKGAYKDTSRKRENPNPEAFRDSRSARVQTRIEGETDSGNRWLLTPYARATEMQFLMHFLPGTPLEENGQRGVGIKSAYFTSASENLSVTSGVDLELTDGWLEQSQEGGFSSFPAGRHYDYDVTAAVAAAFSSAEFALSGATQLSAGARYEYLRYDYDNRMISGDTAEDGSICISSYTGAEGCRYTRPADRRDDFANLSADASLLHHFSDRLSGVVRLARGFRAPQVTELYRLQNGQMEADLDSESIDSLELGLRGTLQQLRFSFTAFYMEKADVIFQSSERLNLSEGETRHYGLEYDVGWQLADRWRLALAGTLARHRYTNDVSAPGSSELIETRGNDIDTAPRRMHTLNLQWSPGDATTAELQWRRMGAYYTDIENDHRYDGHDLLNLRLRQRLSEKLEVGLRVHNLADVDYAERADYSSLGGGDRYFIGEPRSFFADISLAL